MNMEVGQIGATEVVRDARMCKWYLAQLRPGGLARAEANLGRQGFFSFMPRLETTRRTCGALRATLRPLFPGYLFVGLRNEEQPWRKINSTYGVARLVTLDGRNPTPVPLSIVEYLRARCASGIWAPEPDALRVGTRVRLLGGPFAGTLATIASLPDSDRVIVLFDMMGRGVRASVSRSSLTPLETR